MFITSTRFVITSHHPLARLTAQPPRRRIFSAMQTFKPENWKIAKRAAVIIVCALLPPVSRRPVLTRWQRNNMCSSPPPKRVMKSRWVCCVSRQLVIAVPCALN